MFMKLFSVLVSVAVSACASVATVDRIEECPNGDIAVVEYGDIYVDIPLASLNEDVAQGEKLAVTSVVGTFTAYDYDNRMAQFKSYDNEVWWSLTFDEIGDIPSLNVPYPVSYLENGTTACECDYCDNCWREDDIRLSVELTK